MFHSPEYIAAQQEYERALFRRAVVYGASQPIQLQAVFGIASAEKARHEIRQKFSETAKAQTIYNRIFQSLWRAGESFDAWEKANGDYHSVVAAFQKMAEDKHETGRVVKGLSPYRLWMSSQSQGLTWPLYQSIRDDIQDFYLKIKNTSETTFPNEIVTVDLDTVRMLSKSIRDDMGVDATRLEIGQVKHPLTLGNRDRVYLGLNDEEGSADIVQYIYSVLLHEHGHVLLRQNVDLMMNAAIDESIAMFFDLAIGRTEATAHYIAKKLEKAGVAKIDRIPLVNRLTCRQPNALRAHTDPLTYMPAVFLSAAFEEAMIDAPESVSEGIAKWRSLSGEFSVSDAMSKAGPLQDMQPFTGETCGRLPGYAVGVVMAFQLFEKFDRDVGFSWQIELSEGNFRPIVSWLQNNVFPYADEKDFQTFIQKSTGTKLSTRPYKREMQLRYGA